MSRKSLILLLPLALLLAGCLDRELPTALTPEEALFDHVGASYVVTNTNDSGEGSLRYAIEHVEAGGTITFAAALNGQTITLTSGQLTIAKDLTLTGPGANLLTVARSSSADGFRIFEINSGTTVSLSGLTITGSRGNVTGGGILNDGTLTLTNSTVSGNKGASGGGIFNSTAGTLTLTNSTVSGNETALGGGGIYNRGTLTLTHSTVSGNSAFDPSGGVPGGGIVNHGTLTLMHSTVSDNTASYGLGGGISHNRGTLTLMHSTVSDNTASYGLGGGIYHTGGTVTLTHSTVSGNEGDYGGGILTREIPHLPRGDLTLRSSLVAGNTGSSSPDLHHEGTSLSIEYSLIGDPSGNGITATAENGNLVGTAETPLDPKLGPLADNGGPTWTHALLEDSPAIDHIPVGTNGCGTTITTDQRGYSRPAGSGCDIGAFEYGASLTTATTTKLSLTPSSQQYSDRITLSAEVLPTGATGSVQFKINGSNAGSAIALSGGAATLANHPITLGQGSYTVEAIFTSTSSSFSGSSDSQTLTVTKEDATILYASGNPAALQVSTAGGSLNAGALSLALQVREKELDVAVSPGATGIGSIANAGLSLTLVPVGPGGSHTLNCSATGVSGSGYAATRSFTCTNPAPLPVNTYEVQASVTGNYYTGSYTDAFTVYDPSLGFATGGGSFLLQGERVNFGFTMKYNRSGTNLQGNLIVVRHHADGTVSRLKSNALGSLALGEDTSVPMGWASFGGRATYTTWNGSEYVTVGNQNFQVYVEDRNHPGSGTDRIWLSGASGLSLPGTLSTARSNTTALTGGNISVLHKSAKK